MPERILEQSIFISAPSFNVWAALYDVDQWKAWNRNIKQVDLLETPKVDAIGMIVLISGSTYQFRITRSIPSALLEWEREYALETILTQTFSLVPSIDGTVLTAALSCRGIFKKPVSIILGRRLAGDLGRQLDGLKDWAERMRIGGQAMSQDGNGSVSIGKGRV